MVEPLVSGQVSQPLKSGSQFVIHYNTQKNLFNIQKQQFNFSVPLWVKIYICDKQKQ